MANIQAGLEIKAGVSGVENIDALAQSIEAAGIDTGKLTTEAKELGATLAKAQAQQAQLQNIRRCRRNWTIPLKKCVHWTS